LAESASRARHRVTEAREPMSIEMRSSHPSAAEIATRIEQFIETEIIPSEKDPRCTPHGPSEELVLELRERARGAGLLTPHIMGDGTHLTHRETAILLRAAGYSPLGPVALNVAAPDEGNMYLLGKAGSAAQKERYLKPLIAGRIRSAFFMTEPARMGGAGSDPSMLQTTAKHEAGHWIIRGTKAFITGAKGANLGIIVAKTTVGATLFLVDLPNPAVEVERILNTIDSSMPGGHAVIRIDGLCVPSDQILGELDQGFKYAQVRLAPARLTHCMRWLGAALRCQRIATEYAVRRTAFGKQLIDHEGVGFMLADNLIELRQCELMIDWCATILDSGASAIHESSMTKAAVSEALFRIVDRCVQVMGGTGITTDTIVEHIFRELRAFRIYDGPTEVHKWSIAKTIKKDFLSSGGK
jgi:acyl-CoA dehydrogenase